MSKLQENILSAGNHHLDTFGPSLLPTTEDEILSKFSRGINKKVDLEIMSKYLAYKPVDVIRQTLRNTT